VNIFFLDSDATTAAEWQCDRHVIKMILETAQLLSTAHRELDGDGWADEIGLYKRTHKNHPSAVWARASTAHYRWLYRHFCALCNEYRYRYGKEHKTWSKIGTMLSESPDNCPVDGWTDPPQCMPDVYKHRSTVQAYRNYYTLDKSQNDWFYYKKNRCRPYWLANLEGSYYAK
jgi:hypothetical protein